MDTLIKALQEYERIRKTSADSGEFPVEQAKRDAENALIEIIDRRIKTHMGRERRSTTSTKPIKEGFNAELLPYIEALNSAPTPPYVEDLMSSGNVSQWFAAYADWYYHQCKKALK